MKSVITQVAREEASRFLRHLQERWRDGARARPASARRVLDQPAPVAAEPPPPLAVELPVAARGASAPPAARKASAVAQRRRSPGNAARRASAKATARSDDTISSVDINTASRAELVALPGIGLSRADAIIDGRPYAGASELLDRRILPKAVFTSLRERLRVG